MLTHQPHALAAALTQDELQRTVRGLVAARTALQSAQRGLCVAAFSAGAVHVARSSADLVQVLAELEASAAALHHGLDPRQPEYIALCEAFGLPQDTI